MNQRPSGPQPDALPAQREPHRIRALATGSEGVAQVLSPVGVDAVKRLVERVDAHASGVQVIGARPARRLDLARMCPGALL